MWKSYRDIYILMPLNSSYHKTFREFYKYIQITYQDHRTQSRQMYINCHCSKRKWLPFSMFEWYERNLLTDFHEIAKIGRTWCNNLDVPHYCLNQGIFLFYACGGGWVVGVVGGGGYICIRWKCMGGFSWKFRERLYTVNRAIKKKRVWPR